MYAGGVDEKEFVELMRALRFKRMSMQTMGMWRVGDVSISLDRAIAATGTAHATYAASLSISLDCAIAATGTA
jgi:hypothetical protein